MIKNSPGWAVELTGEKFDLDDFRELLTCPFNPWIEDYSTDDGLKPLLRSTNWVNLTEAANVFLDASRMIERLNGAALLIHSDARPLKLGQTMRFASDGRREPIIFAATGSLRATLGRVRFRATAVTSAPPEPRRESSLQKWLREAETDDTRADLFAHLTRADNWYDLYKTAELARRLAGSQKALKATLATNWKEWEQVWRTANHYRHAPDPVK